jgi:hypothetical protein
LILALISSQESSGELGNHSLGESEASTVVCGVGSTSRNSFDLVMLDDEGGQDDLRLRMPEKVLVLISQGESKALPRPVELVFPRGAPRLFSGLIRIGDGFPHRFLLLSGRGDFVRSDVECVAAAKS